MAPKRPRSPDADAWNECDCARLLKTYDISQTPELRELNVKAGGYFDRLHEESWTCEICYDTELQIGNPRQYQEQFKDPVVFSPFVLCISFIGPHGEDGTMSIEELIEYVRRSFSDLQDSRANSGIIVTRDAHSIHIRMACMPRYCEICGVCEDCRAQLPAVNILIESLGIMCQKICARQMESGDATRRSYPKTDPKVLKELLLRLSCGFQRNGSHDRDTSSRDHSLLHVAAGRRKLIASTYDSAPCNGFIYDIAKLSLERWYPEPGTFPTTPQCIMCCDLFTEVALLELPCHCFICVDCLGRYFESALSS